MNELDDYKAQEKGQQEKDESMLRQESILTWKSLVEGTARAKAIAALTDSRTIANWSCGAWSWQRMQAGEEMMVIAVLQDICPMVSRFWVRIPVCAPKRAAAKAASRNESASETLGEAASAKAGGGIVGGGAVPARLGSGEGEDSNNDAGAAVHSSSDWNQASAIVAIVLRAHTLL